jgi:hypothetical protein
MNIGDNIAICEALGIDASQVKRLVITIAPEGAQVEATLRPSGDVAKAIINVVKKYKLVPIEETETA